MATRARRHRARRGRGPRESASAWPPPIKTLTSEVLQVYFHVLLSPLRGSYDFELCAVNRRAVEFPNVRDALHKKPIRHFEYNPMDHSRYASRLGLQLSENASHRGETQQQLPGTILLLRGALEAQRLPVA